MKIYCIANAATDVTEVAELKGLARGSSRI